MKSNRREAEFRSDGSPKSFDDVVLSARRQSGSDSAVNQRRDVGAPDAAGTSAKADSSTASSPELAEERSIWQQTPYTRKEFTIRNAAPSPCAENSIYSIEFCQSDPDRSGSSSRGDNRVDASHPEETTADANGALFIPKRILDPKPPTGHHGDLSSVKPRNLNAGSSSGSCRPDPEEEYSGFKEDEMTLLDENTAFGSAYAALGYNESSSLGNKDNKKQAKNAMKLADRLVTVPLSKVWHVFSETIVNLIMLLNVVVAVVDIAMAPQYLHYKISAFLLGLVENGVTVSLWAVRHHPSFKNSPDRKRLERYQQYVENVLGEVLIYPLLVVSVLGFTTDKMYEAGGAFLYVQVGLITCDVATMLYNGVLRMHMLRRLMKDLGGVLEAGSDNRKGLWRMAGYILPRCYWTITCNVLLSLAVTVMFGIQTNRDNLTTSDYRLTAASGLIMVVIVVLPTASLLLFFVSNLFWIMEMLMKINIGVGANVQFQEKLREEYGDSMSDALQYSRTKIPATEKRLAAIQDSSTMTKLLYCLYEVQFVAMIFAWQWILFAAIYFFDGFDNASWNLTAKLMFVVLFAVANPHLALLMTLNNFMVVALLMGTVVYPFCLPLCCRQKPQSKYSQLTSKS